MDVVTTGRGTPSGNALVPVFKMTANKITFKKMKENMDFDASPVISGTKSIEKMGEELLEEIMAVANGKVVKAEAFGFNDIAISRLCNYV